MTKTAIDIDRITSAAGVLSHRDLPPDIQEDAAAFLNALDHALPALLRAERDTAAGQPPWTDAALAHRIKGELESALLLIACYRTVPPPSAAGDRWAMEAALGIHSNMDQRAAINDPASPLCLPLRLWALLRADSLRRSGAEEGPPEAGYNLAENLLLCAVKITIPPEYLRWLHEGYPDFYNDWAARRDANREK